MSDVKEQSEFAPSPGKIRPAQLITTHGPGAIVQTLEDSVLVLGINFWGHKDEYIKKNHMYLQKITKKDHFLMPHTSEPSHRTIACTSFPRWGHCRYCKWLQFHKDYPLTENGFFCKTHTKSILLPARLVCVCKKGHLDDFPWVKWAHSNKKKPMPICDKPKIQWVGGRQTSSMSNFKLVCECGAENSLFGAMDSKGIELYDAEKDEFYTHSCTGELPWLQKQEQCTKTKKDRTQDKDSTEVPIGVIARATSLHYSKTIKGIIIPELAHPIVKYLQTEEFETKVKSYREIDENITDEKIAELILKSNTDFQIAGYTKEQIVEFMEKLEERHGGIEINTEQDLKQIEYNDLISNESFQDEQIEKEIEIQNIELTDELKKYFKHVRRLDVLTALEVSRYFTRLKPPGEIFVENENFTNDTICSLEVNGKTKFGQPFSKSKWLPCAIKKGEGIFLVFDKNFIENCITGEMKKRLDSIIDNHKEWEEVQNWPSDSGVDRQYILLHSLSHILIKEFAIQSGYEEASISERIYSSESMCGILFYTTSSGEGSLGGLVRQAEETNLLNILKKAFAKAKTCSRDPICILDDPKSMKEKKLPLQLRQNGSACYACMMIPETSCENFNKMLDRRVLVDRDYGIDKVFL